MLGVPHRRLGLVRRGLLSSPLKREIDRHRQQLAQLRNRGVRVLQMLPGDIDDVGQAFAVLACFTDEFEDQKFSKTQRTKAFDVGRELVRLSLLRSSTEEILTYTPVCHLGRRFIC